MELLEDFYHATNSARPLGEGGSLLRILSLPTEFLSSCVRNRREAELLLNISSSAVSLDTISRIYESVALRTQALQEGGNSLWLAQEPLLLPAIPIIGHQLSRVNQMRATLFKRIDREVQNLQVLGKMLVHYIDVNLVVAEELQMEGLLRIADDKIVLAKMEQELVMRINHICTQDHQNVHMFRPLADLISEIRGKKGDGNVPVKLDEALKGRESEQLEHVIHSARKKSTTYDVNTRALTEEDVKNNEPKGEGDGNRNGNGADALMDRISLARKEPTAGMSSSTTCSYSSIDPSLRVINNCSSASEERLPKKVVDERWDDLSSSREMKEPQADKLVDAIPFGSIVAVNSDPNALTLEQNATIPIWTNLGENKVMSNGDDLKGDTGLCLGVIVEVEDTTCESKGLSVNQEGNKKHLLCSVENSPPMEDMYATTYTNHFETLWCLDSQRGKALCTQSGKVKKRKNSFIEIGQKQVENLRCILEFDLEEDASDCQRPQKLSKEGRMKGAISRDGHLMSSNVDNVRQICDGHLQDNSFTMDSFVSVSNPDVEFAEFSGQFEGNLPATPTLSSESVHESKSHLDLRCDKNAVKNSVLKVRMGQLQLETRK